MEGHLLQWWAGEWCSKVEGECQNWFPPIRLKEGKKKKNDAHQLFLSWRKFLQILPH